MVTIVFLTEWCGEFLKFSTKTFVERLVLEHWKILLSGDSVQWKLLKEFWERSPTLACNIMYSNPLSLSVYRLHTLCVWGVVLYTICDHLLCYLIKCLTVLSRVLELSRLHYFLKRVKMTKLYNIYMIYSRIFPSKNVFAEQEN